MQYSPSRGRARSTSQSVGARARCQRGAHCMPLRAIQCAPLSAPISLARSRARALNHDSRVEQLEHDRGRHRASVGA